MLGYLRKPETMDSPSKTEDLLFGRTWAMFGGVLGTPLQFLAVVLQQLAHGCFNKGTQ